MRAVYKELVDNSLAAALSAIEIYNKPNFLYRNETFVILIINAWELLFKAKILKDNNHKKTSIYIKQSNGRYKISRTGNYMTIEIRGAMNKIEINSLVKENIENLLEIRDTAIHFYNKKSISYTIFSLGAATLQNYQKLIKKWFNQDLSNYNLYILPLGFSYSFKNFSLMDLSKEPDAMKNLLNNIITQQNKGDVKKDGFYFIADVETKLISAKKIPKKVQAHLTIAIDKNSTNATIFKPESIIDKYPLSGNELWNLVKENIPEIKQNVYYRFLKDHNMRNDTRYSNYNFHNKKQREKYKKNGTVPGGVTPIYNYDALEYILSNIETN